MGFYFRANRARFSATPFSGQLHILIRDSMLREAKLGRAQLALTGSSFIYKELYRSEVQTFSSSAI